MLIQANIRARSTLLDFPDLERFVHEISTTQYDVVGISAIIPNVEKVRVMCQLIRKHLPAATVVVGGHVANLSDLAERIDADHIVKGEGVRWMRRFLRDDESRPIKHPRIPAGFGARMMGVALPENGSGNAATLIPSVGCPVGCNFCSTSAMFGGKGKCIHFYETGDELFEVMCDLERDMRVRSFFVIDENFLMHRKRAMRLMDLMIDHDKAWALHVFSSASVLRSYSMRQLVDLGIFWVWIGLEGENSQYAKLNGTDTRRLVRELQSHGIRVLGSSIIGLEDHTPENIEAAIDYAVSHDTDFHQFMLYMPIPGTPLHAEHQAAGTLLDSSECPEADIHGQYRFNYRHPHIASGKETDLLLRAFVRDFAVNGPSIVRLARTMLKGWQRYKNDPSRRIRRRFAWYTRGLGTTYAGALWAARHWYRREPAMAKKISRILRDIYRELGLKSRLLAPLVGRYVRVMMAREHRRLRAGWTYEPPTSCESSHAIAAENAAAHQSTSSIAAT